MMIVRETFERCVCSRRRNPTPTDVGPSTPSVRPGRCWSGPSSLSVCTATDREEPQDSPARQSNGGDGHNDDGSGGHGDVALLPETTHRGYSSLQKIYPQRATQDIDRLRLFDPAIDIFVECVGGTRDQTRMNSHTFRNFVRSVLRLMLHVIRTLLRANTLTPTGFWQDRPRKNCNDLTFYADFWQRVSIACYAKRCPSHDRFCLSDRPSDRPTVCPSQSGIMPKRLQLRSCGLHWG